MLEPLSNPSVHSDEQARRRLAVEPPAGLLPYWQPRVSVRPRQIESLC
jgi:hypothetical protein